MVVYSARFLVIKKGKIIVGLMQEKANSDSKNSTQPIIVKKSWIDFLFFLK